MTIRIVPLSGIDIRLAPGPWPLPPELRAAVPQRWAEMVADNPHLWDGRVLGVMHPRVDEDGVLRGRAHEDAFSTFMTWRGAGFPDCGITNLFGSALIVSNDGAIILGVMGADTANAGRVYPPGGSLEPRDVGPDEQVDVLGSIAVELTEETGLDIAEARVGALLAIFDGPRVSVAQGLHFPQSAEVLLARIRENLDTQEHRELADVVAVRTLAELEAAGEVLPYIGALLSAYEERRVSL